MKKCISCGAEKNINDFYIHSAMRDGHLNKCISCCKIQSSNRYAIITESVEGLEKERLRQRQKYHRLGYSKKQKEWDKNKPWKKTSVYKNLSRKFKTSKGLELHHWNYNHYFLEDVIILTSKEHKKAHKYLIFDEETSMFTDIHGKLLKTKDVHLYYLKSKGICF